MSLFADSDDSSRLFEFACAEISRRLEDGESYPSASLFQEYPSLASDPQLAVALIRTECLARFNLGQQPCAEEYIDRFPQLREPLSKVFRDLTIGDEKPTVAASEQEIEPTPPSEPLVRFGRYEITDELGQGAMGVVYRAFDTQLSRWVALKVIARGTLASATDVQRLYREAQAAASLVHRHAIPVYDIGSHEGQHYYVMKLASAGNLARRRGQFKDLKAAVTLLEKVSRAVGAAHAQGVIHRDLKPGNILFDEDGEPLVADFGLAKRSGDPELTLQGQALGTPSYMAPEQAAGQNGTVSAASDVWALGVILYELVTGGKRPFSAATSEGILQSVLNGSPVPPSRRSQGIDRQLETIILKCLNRDQADRFSDANALADDLARWLSGQPVLARPRPWPRRAWEQIAGRGNRRRTAILLGAAAIAAFIFAASLMLPRSAATSETPSDLGELNAIFHEIAEGTHPVTLVGATGGPRRSRWRTEEGRAPIKADASLPLRITSFDRTLLELLPDPQSERFRLCAQVRVENYGPGYFSCGLFFSAYTLPPPEEYKHHFLVLQFRDLDRIYEPVEIQFISYLDTPTRRPAEELENKLTALRPSPGVASLGLSLGATTGESGLQTLSLIPAGGMHASYASWHALELIVTNEQIVGRFDDRPLRPLTREKLDFRMDAPFQIAERRGETKPIFMPHGALGLYVASGSASFRNVTIETVNNP